MYSGATDKGTEGELVSVSQVQGFEDALITA